MPLRSPLRHRASESSIEPWTPARPTAASRPSRGIALPGIMFAANPWSCMSNAKPGGRSPPRRSKAEPRDRRRHAAPPKGRGAQRPGEIPNACGPCGDAVENGLVTNLAWRGSTVTGLPRLSAELMGKRTKVVRKLVPQANRIARAGQTGSPRRSIQHGNARCAIHGRPAPCHPEQNNDVRNRARKQEPRARKSAGVSCLAVMVGPFVTFARLARRDGRAGRLGNR